MNKPVLSAIGVAIVDTSVFELREDITGLEKVFTNLENEFTTPSTQICEYALGNNTIIPLDVCLVINRTSSIAAGSSGGTEVKVYSIFTATKKGFGWTPVIIVLTIMYFGLIIIGVKYKSFLIVAPCNNPSNT